MVLGASKLFSEPGWDQPDRLKIFIFNWEYFAGWQQRGDKKCIHICEVCIFVPFQFVTIYRVHGISMIKQEEIVLVPA